MAVLSFLGSELVGLMVVYLHTRLTLRRARA
jgi:hypothetical protein